MIFTVEPMINVGTRPLLESILYSLKSSGFKNINISVNYLQEKIKNYFGNGDSLKLNINYFSEKKRLGTAGPLYFLKKKTARVALRRGLQRWAAGMVAGIVAGLRASPHPAPLPVPAPPPACCVLAYWFEAHVPSSGWTPR